MFVRMSVCIVISYSCTVIYHHLSSWRYDILHLRGTFLKNTKSVSGVVVYTGNETRMVKNSRPAPNKQSHVEKDLNKAATLAVS